MVIRGHICHRNHTFVKNVRQVKEVGGGGGGGGVPQWQIYIYCGEIPIYRNGEVT